MNDSRNGRNKKRVLIIPASYYYFLTILVLENMDDSSNKKRSLIITASYYFLTILTELTNESDSENDSEELVQHFINIEKSLRIRGKRRKIYRVEGYVENIIPRFCTKQFKEHFRIEVSVYDTLENKIGNLLLRQNTSGRSTLPVRKQLLATLWLLATPDSYRLIYC